MDGDLFPFCEQSLVVMTRGKVGREARRLGVTPKDEASDVPELNDLSGGII